MKKQLVSILFALCMVLCLVPLAAFAEESTETPPECSCETACTAENMNTACPVCGSPAGGGRVRPPAGDSLDGVNWRERDGKRSQHRG